MAILLKFSSSASALGSPAPPSPLFTLEALPSLVSSPWVIPETGRTLIFLLIKSSVAKSLKVSAKSGSSPTPSAA